MEAEYQFVAILRSYFRYFTWKGFQTAYNFFGDGNMLAISCTGVENEVARNMYEASELEWLVYNAPVDYVKLLLHGDIQEYLKNVTQYHPFEN